MLEKLTALPVGIVGLQANGRVSKENYERSFEPMLDDARRDGARLRFVLELGPEFEGMSAAAAWEDIKVGLRSTRLFDGCAVVTDIGWVRDTVPLASFLMPFPVKLFAHAERSEAIAWLGTLPEKATMSHYLVPTSGVVVVDIHQPLRAPDFDTLALTVDGWIESHGELHGLVLHAREFPGWENVESMLHHFRFVRDHQKKIERVALALDGSLIGWAPKIASLFVKAEIKSFAYDALESATTWAAGPARKITTSKRDGARIPRATR